jgi:hypothetical protein
MEKEGSRRVESNWACIELCTNTAVNVVHGSVDVTGMKDFVPVLRESPRDLPDPADQFGRPEAGREGRTLASGAKIGVMLLGSSPLGTWEAFQERAPTEGGLFAECILDSMPWVKGWGREIMFREERIVRVMAGSVSELLRCRRSCRRELCQKGSPRERGSG